MVKVANLIAISTLGELLLVCKKGVWITPGGKLFEGESYEECLTRELSEELPGVEVKLTKRWRDFEGFTPRSKTPISISTYFGTVAGLIYPAAEISDARYVGDTDGFVLSDATLEIRALLINDGYLKG
jgi:ADP-ribose pyrophosphatase YjhB (NUDIX family)